MAETRTSPDELELRLELIEDLIAQGLNQRLIVRYVMDNEEKLGWHVSDRQIRNYYQAAMRRLSKGAGKIDRREFHTRSLKRLDYLYRVSLEKDDRRTALSCEKEIINLLHLDEPSRELDWREAAEKAGINPDNVLERILSAHAEMQVLEVADDE